MIISLIQILSATWFSGQNLVAARNPGCDRRCQCEDFRVNCTGGGLTTIPYSLDVKTTELILSNNDIRSISADEIGIYPRLTLLDLTNQTQRIRLRFAPFKGLKFLSDLTFHASQFQELQLENFEGLESLRLLDLSRTNINEFLPLPLFKDLDGLTSLNLAHNDLRTISTSLFYGLKGLEILDLNNNNLIEVPILASSPKLRLLDLHGNSIESLSEESFDGLLNLETLRLDHNPLRLIEDGAFSHLKSLKELYLVNTHLKLIPVGSLGLLPNLEYIDLSFSHVSVIQRHAFTGLRHLTHISINNCDLLTGIESEAFLGLPHLQFLALSHNSRLSGVESDWIKDVPSLHQILISDNNLHYLPEADISLTSLKRIDAAGNPWNCDCKLTWLAAACRNLNPPCRAECSSPESVTGLPLANVLDQRCMEPRKSPVGNEGLQTLYIVLLVAVPLILLAITAICCYFLRNRLQACCGKGRASCLCKRSSFQSKQPLVGVAKWRRKDKDLTSTSTDFAANQPERTGEQPAFKVLAEYPIPITEL